MSYKYNLDQTKLSLVQTFRLTNLRELSSGLAYSAVPTARSALTSFIQLYGMKLIGNPPISRFNYVRTVQQEPSVAQIGDNNIIIIIISDLLIALSRSRRLNYEGRSSTRSDRRSCAAG